MRLVVDVTVPILPSINSSSNNHWARRRKDRKALQLLVAAYLRKNRPKEPLVRAVVHLTRRSSGVPPDPDNLAESFKGVLDQLTARRRGARVLGSGIIQDDSPAHARIRYLHEKGKRGQGEIRIQVWDATQDVSEEWYQ